MRPSKAADMTAVRRRWLIVADRRQGLSVAGVIRDLEL
jgi:hypothetical protein